MPSSSTATYLVAYAKGASASDARAVIARLGGTIMLENRALGYAKVSTTNAFCGGGGGFNDFYGHGIVNALKAVGG